MLQVWLAGEMDRERVNGLQDALGLRRAAATAAGLGVGEIWVQPGIDGQA